MMKTGKGSTDIAPDVQALHELYGGIALGAVVGQVVFLISDAHMLVSYCWWIGICMAVFWAWHMHKSLMDAFYMNEGDAVGHIRSHAIIRYIAAVAAMAVLYIRIQEEQRVYAMAYIFGLLMLKVGAYLQPGVHRLYVMLGLSVEPECSDNVTDSEDESISHTDG